MIIIIIIFLWPADESSSCVEYQFPSVTGEHIIIIAGSDIATLYNP